MISIRLYSYQGFLDSFSDLFSCWLGSDYFSVVETAEIDEFNRFKPCPTADFSVLFMQEVASTREEQVEWFTRMTGKITGNTNAKTLIILVSPYSDFYNDGVQQLYIENVPNITVRFLKSFRLLQEEVIELKSAIASFVTASVLNCAIDFYLLKSIQPLIRKISDIISSLAGHEPTELRSLTVDGFEEVHKLIREIDSVENRALSIVEKKMLYFEKLLSWNVTKYLANRSQDQPSEIVQFYYLILVGVSYFFERVLSLDSNLRCSVCGTETVKICSRCEKRCYCSAKHQKFDWNSHQEICGAFDDIRVLKSTCMDYFRNHPSMELVGLWRRNESPDDPGGIIEITIASIILKSATYLITRWINAYAFEVDCGQGNNWLYVKNTANGELYGYPIGQKGAASLVYRRL